MLYKEFLEKLTPNEWKEEKRNIRIEKRRIKKEAQQVRPRTIISHVTMILLLNNTLAIFLGTPSDSCSIC